MTKKTKLTAELESLLARRKQIEDRLESLTPGLDVEGVTTQLLLDNRGKMTPAEAVEQAQKIQAEKTALQHEETALADAIRAELSTLKEHLDQMREVAQSKAEKLEDKCFLDWMKDASELIEDSKAREQIFILTSAAAPVIEAYEKLVSIPRIYENTHGFTWRIQKIERPDFRELEARTPLTHPRVHNSNSGDEDDLGELLAAVNAL